jgi:hypothetical protein
MAGDRSGLPLQQIVPNRRPLGVTVEFKHRSGVIHQFMSVSDEMATYVDELVADHIEWIVRKEVEGAAIPALAPNQLAAAFRFWFRRPGRFFDNGYMLTINHQSDAQQFRQLNLWMRRAAAATFTGLASEQARTQALVRAATAFCADQAVTPTAPPESEGMHPLLRDFH